VNSQTLLTGVLLLLGAGFFVANTKLVFTYTKFLKRRPSAVLTWPSPTPPNHPFALAIGVALGILVFVKIVVLRMQAIGETMMFAYYAFLVPLSLRIGRGFYEDGIWVDSGSLFDTGFIPYNEIGGISWREGEHQVTLIVVSRLRNLARRLNVPGDKYGAARRLLRDKIGEHEIHFTGTGLDLGGHDERDDA
jgi:hypothetical protein